MPEAGILDTSVVIDLLGIDDDHLPAESAITAVTLAELAAGSHATSDVIQRSIRQERVQWAEATFDALPFDIAAARSYGRVYALVRAARRQPRGRLRRPHDRVRRRSERPTALHPQSDRLRRTGVNGHRRRGVTTLNVVAAQHSFSEKIAKARARPTQYRAREAVRMLPLALVATLLIEGTPAAPRSGGHGTEAAVGQVG